MRATICAAVLGLGLLASGCDWSSPDCTFDDDCDWPMTCIDGHCLDDSCPGGCFGGEYCSNGYCYDCTVSEHCGQACIDCEAQLDNMRCVLYLNNPEPLYQCGCWSNADCGGNRCCAGEQCTNCY